MDIVMIGAGGIGSYFLPLFLKIFKGAVEIWDHDTLETRNLDRQQFDPKLVGMNKAEALKLSQLPCFRDRITTVDAWFTDHAVVNSPVDCIVACPDNHMARKAAMVVAEDRRLPAVIGANGTFDSMAYVFLPDYRGTKVDPRVRYPDILTNKEGSPLTSCTGEAQEATPQLAFANHRAANQMIQLLFTLSEIEENEALPIELSTSRYENSYLSLEQAFART